MELSLRENHVGNSFNPLGDLLAVPDNHFALWMRRYVVGDKEASFSR